jgi:acetyl esterase
MTIKTVLGPAAQEFAEATAYAPFLFDPRPEKGRETVDDVQSGCSVSVRTAAGPASAF